jgi:hypothetical protein
MELTVHVHLVWRREGRTTDRYALISHMQLSAQSSHAESGRDKIFLYSANCPHPFFGPLSILFGGHRISFARVKRPERKVNHSSPLNVEVKNQWSYTFTPLVCLHREYFIFYLYIPCWVHESLLHHISGSNSDSEVETKDLKMCAVCIEALRRSGGITLYEW